MVKPFYLLLADAGQKCITTYIKDGAFRDGQSMVKWIKKMMGVGLLIIQTLTSLFIK